MIQIKPKILHQPTCPGCKTALLPEKILWQGIHVCTVSYCKLCRSEIVSDLEIGHAVFAPCQLDMTLGRLFIKEYKYNHWFGDPFLKSMMNPMNSTATHLTVEKFVNFNKVVVLNCIDFLYGHSLLKLLNAETYLGKSKNIGLIVIIQPFLRWMVPKGVAEIWNVNIPLSEARNYYPNLNRLINEECMRFDEIYVSRAHSHPKTLDISSFTGVSKHDFNKTEYRISFIWREDRIWSSNKYSTIMIKNSKLSKYALLIQQNLKIRRFFNLLRRTFRKTFFTVAGFGRSTKFPSWIDDLRVDRYDEDSERKLCILYSESRLVVGIHGSNMLLPTAHAGMAIDLMPLDRWSNFSQDVIFSPALDDVRLASYRFRYLPVNIKLDLLAHIATEQLRWHDYFNKQWALEINL